MPVLPSIIVAMVLALAVEISRNYPITRRKCVRPTPGAKCETVDVFWPAQDGLQNASDNGQVRYY